MAYIPNYQSVTEHDFISLALAHDAMDKHVLSERTSYGCKFCKNCHMPLNGYNKIDAPHGNKNPANSSFMYAVDEVDVVHKLEYQQRLLAMYMRLGSLTMVGKVLESVWDPTFRPILFKYFMPEHRAISSKYAKVALWVAKKPGQADDECRRYASLDPTWALEYALRVDKTATPTTRAAACRQGATALDYARHVDGCYNVSTFSKTLQDKELAFKYMASYPTPEAKDAVFNMFVQNGDAITAIDWAKVCGGNDAARDIVLARGNLEEVVRYALHNHGKPDDKLRARIVAEGSPKQACLYARDVDKCGRDDTRQLAAKEPALAAEYASSVDKAPHDTTRQACLALPARAAEYARHIDKCPRDDTRLAAAADPKSAVYYACYIDNARHPVTLAGALRYSHTAYQYACNLGACDATRTAACKNSSTAFEYAANVDKRPSDETRLAASYAEGTAQQYESWAASIKRQEEAEANDKANAVAPAVREV